MSRFFEYLTSQPVLLRGALHFPDSMKRFRHSLATTLLLWIALACCACAESKTQSAVTDEAGILSEKQRDQINSLIATHNQKGPGRIAVLIVQKLPPGTTIEQLAAARINQPLPATGEKLDRVLLAIALHDRKMRIETSKDVWPLLSDSFCKTVIDKTIAPHFRQTNYFEGIHAGLSALTNKLASR